MSMGPSQLCHSLITPEIGALEYISQQISAPITDHEAVETCIDVLANFFGDPDLQLNSTINTSIPDWLELLSHLAQQPGGNLPF